MESKTILTGITPSGTPHLGNYIGMIKPAVAMSAEDGRNCYYFISDLHALVKCHDAECVGRFTLEIAAAWLALGLDPERVLFYRQSRVPEIAELHWMLSCVTPKGLLNRAHAYKALRERNTAGGVDADTDVSLGLFSYPVLMAADILLFDADFVPVGKDQVQHVEIARDIAGSFNARYGVQFRLPRAMVGDAQSLPGLAGPRTLYRDYLEHPQRIETVLDQGEERVRRIAHARMQGIRRAVGLRRPVSAVPATIDSASARHGPVA